MRKQFLREQPPKTYSIQLDGETIKNGSGNTHHMAKGTFPNIYLLFSHIISLGFYPEN